MRVYSVDPSDPFLQTLAERLVDGTLWPDRVRPSEPLALASVRIFLPTRRAARALEEAILTAARGPTVLPAIEALGETEPGEGGDEDVLGDLEARSDLAPLVRTFAEHTMPAGSRALFPSTGPDAVRLADELLSLFDQIETQELEWSRLPDLVERADLAAHWETTSGFLTYAADSWRRHLTENGKRSAAQARIARAKASQEALGDASGPVIVAGSTGSIPATRRLIRAIAAHPFGAVVLPGFDRTATPQDWQALAEAEDAPSHPQYGMKQLLDALDLAPSSVARLAPAAAGRSERSAVWSAAFRPAPQTDLWPLDRNRLDLHAGLSAIAMVEADDERTEAAAAALAMREALEEGRTTALVTPHRALARRVTHALARWDIAVDDSAGEPLLATPAGIFARLVANVAAGGGAADWLGLLKHPLMACGSPQDIALAERLFRGPKLAPNAVLTMLEDTGPDGEVFAQALREGLGPLLRLRGVHKVAEFAAAHAAVIATLMRGAEAAAEHQLADVLASLSKADFFTIDAQDWPQTFETLTRGMVVRRPLQSDAVRILGPLEARLQAFQHVVIGGLNEGVWPAAPDAGPWMSRGMMRAFGLDLPERRIGLSAHDVFIAANAPHVTLTRALKSGGEPTVASRWWQRLCALCGEASEPALARGRRLVALAAVLDTPGAASAVERPAPRPPVQVRPTTFAVTEVGQLVRDPYAFYAKRILDLRPLDPLEADPDARDRGILIHQVMHRFWACGGIATNSPQEAWREACEAALQTLRHAPEARALWGARLSHIGAAVIAAETERSACWTPIAAEASGEMTIAGANLTGRLDRVDASPKGALAIIDYKSGKAPGTGEVENLLQPQLPLEAMLVRAGALPLPHKAPLGQLAYVSIGQGRTPVAWRIIGAKDPAGTAETLALKAAENFAGLVVRYRDPQTPYLSRARIKLQEDREGDYDHLARTAEWMN